MILIIAITVITCIATYFLIKRDDEEKQSFTTDCLIGLILLGICAIPSLILMSVLEHFNVLQEYKVIPITLPILTLGFLAVWATWGKSKSGNDTDEKKDDFTAEAIILTAVLSENDSSDDSSSSNSSGSSNSSSSSSSDDFLFCNEYKFWKRSLEGNKLFKCDRCGETTPRIGYKRFLGL